MFAVAQRSLLSVRTLAMGSHQARVAGLRAMSTSAVARKGMYRFSLMPDLVQELYLKEVKSYKAPERSADAHKGQVREFTQPPKPTAPSMPSSSEVASQLEAYTASEPDAPEKVSSSAEEDVTEQQDVNEYLKELQADVKVEAHH